MKKETILTIKNIYNKILNRACTNYELYIYSSALESGMNINSLKDILLSSGEYRYINNIRKNNKFKKNFTKDEIDFVKAKKIAICFSGHARNLNKTHLNIKKLLIEPFNADVFIHTWDSLGTQIFSTDNIGIEYDLTKLNMNYIDLINSLKPKKIKIESFENKISSFEIPNLFFMYGAPVNNSVINSTAKPKNIISQLYSINESLKLLKQHEEEMNEKYDFIIKIRFDFMPESIISYDDFVNSVENKTFIFTLNKDKSSSDFLNCNKCKSNIEHIIHDNLISDIFLFGNSNSMTQYMSHFNLYLENYNYLINNMDKKDIDKLYKKNNIIFVDNLSYAINKFPCFFPENLLRIQLKNLNIFDSNFFGYILR